jgi:glycosyltransferase involved in cell wall biosynthesis
MVTTVHDLAEFHTPGHHTVIRRLYRKYVLRFLARRASHIITISQNSRRDIHQICGVPLAKITVAYPGVDARFRPLDRAYCRSIIRAKYGVERPYILYVGAIEHPNKGLVRLIEDFGRLRRRGLLEYLLVIVGGERGGANRIHRAVQDAQLQNDIVFPGFVPFDDLPVLYNAAAVFVYPSLYEGFGLPPVEAMACGTPVACSNTSSLPEVVGGAAVTFDPHNPGEIADAIRALLTTESLRREKASLGFERVKRYSWQSAATATLAVYREVVNHHRGDL